MAGRNPKLLSPIEEYYSSKISLHGSNPDGVDWNSVDGQVLRFEQLSKIISADSSFSLCDLGCGYGAYLDFLGSRYKKFSYTGLDVSNEMINSAKARAGSKPGAVFQVGEYPTHNHDYIVASGIFNVRLDISDIAWWHHIKLTLDAMDKFSSRGFAFNCLTSYSDKDKMEEKLFYSNPLDVFDHCKTNYSRQVALLHDYGLFEFTVLVRKDL